MVLEIVLIGGVIDDAESDQHGKQDGKQAVHRGADIQAGKFLDTKDDEGGEGRPQRPGFETILIYTDSSFASGFSGRARISCS